MWQHYPTVTGFNKTYPQSQYEWGNCTDSLGCSLSSFSYYLTSTAAGVTNSCYSRISCSSRCSSHSTNQIAWKQHKPALILEGIHIWEQRRENEPGISSTAPSIPSSPSIHQSSHRRKVESVHLPGAASQACMVNPMLLPCEKECPQSQWLAKHNPYPVSKREFPAASAVGYQHHIGWVHQVNWGLSGKQALRRILLSYLSSSTTWSKRETLTGS